MVGNFYVQPYLITVIHYDKFVVPVGIEPTTCCMLNNRSPAELRNFIVGTGGFEPTFSTYRYSSPTYQVGLVCANILELSTRIELVSLGYKARIIPLYEESLFYIIFNLSSSCISIWQFAHTNIHLSTSFFNLSNDQDLPPIVKSFSSVSKW